MHPARPPQLAHARIHNGEAGQSLGPGFESCRVVLPNKSIKASVEIFRGEVRIVVQQMIGEIAPHHFLAEDQEVIAGKRCARAVDPGEDWLRAAVVPRPLVAKEQLTVRFDRDMVTWFRQQGRGYQTRMNAVLRAYYEDGVLTKEELDAAIGGKK